MPASEDLVSSKKTLSECQYKQARYMIGWLLDAMCRTFVAISRLRGDMGSLRVDGKSQEGGRSDALQAGAAPKNAEWGQVQLAEQL